MRIKFAKDDAFYMNVAQYRNTGDKWFPLHYPEYVLAKRKL